MKKMILIICCMFASLFIAGAEPSVPSVSAPEIEQTVTAPANVSKKQSVNTGKQTSNLQSANQSFSKLDECTSKMILNVAWMGLLIILCVWGTKLSSKINMPSLLLFLAIGMAANGYNSEIQNVSTEEANLIGSIALAFILFSGGFDTDWKLTKKVGWRGSLLASLGVLITAVLAGTAAYYLFRWCGFKVKLTWCMLLGSIISSTDAAAVFSILRSKSVHLRGRLQSLLEFESGSNDPMAAFLTIFMVGIVLKEEQGLLVFGTDIYRTFLPTFFTKMVLGLVLGLAWGFAITWLYNVINLEYDGLYYVIACGTVLFSFGITEILGGNGYLSVYVTGMWLGNHKFIYHNSVGRFSDGMAWLAQVILFVLLGFLVTPETLLTHYKIGLLIAFALMFLARPIAVFLCLHKSDFSWRERLLVSWVGLRGGAPIMLATYPLIAGVKESNLLFNIVFFIVITSVIFQGMTIMPLARKLHLDLPLLIHPRVPLEFDNTGTLNGETREFEIMPQSPIIGKTIASLGLPREALVLLVRRGGEFVIPHGNTDIQANDGLLILGTEDVLVQAGQVMGVTETEE